MTDISKTLPPTMESNSFVGPIMVLAGGICLGFAPIALRMGLDELGPQAIAFWRYLFATPMLLALVFLIQRRPPAKPNMAIILAGIFFAVDIGLWHWSLTYTTVTISTFLVNLGNLCVGFVAWVVLKERPANMWFLAVIIAIAGAAALSLGGQGGIGSILPRMQVTDPISAVLAYRGELLALCAAVLVSGYMLCSKIARRTLSGIEAIFWLTCVEVCVAALMVIVSGESFKPKTLAGFQIPLFLALVVQISGQGLIITGLGRTPASIAGVLVAVQPVVAAVISWQLFHEPLTSLQAAGGAMILSALWLAQRGKPSTLHQSVKDNV